MKCSAFLTIQLIYNKLRMVSHFPSFLASSKVAVELLPLTGQPVEWEQLQYRHSRAVTGPTHR